MRSIVFGLLGLAAMAMAYPATETMALSEKTELLNNAAMLAELKVETNDFLANYTSTPEFQQLQRWIQSGAAPTAGCSRAFMIFARGTFEPAGTNFMGIMVGYPFLSMLKSVLKDDIDAAGVDYSNSVQGYLTGGDAAGSTKMAQMIREKASQCPNTKIIASGYSQGAQVTHNALNQLGGGGGLLSLLGGGGGGGSISSRIAAVVVFGDPNKGQRISGIDPSKVFTNCLSGDPICSGIPIPLGPHLQYGTSTKELRECVNFVKSHI